MLSRVTVQLRALAVLPLVGLSKTACIFCLAVPEIDPRTYRPTDSGVTGPPHCPGLGRFRFSWSTRVLRDMSRVCLTSQSVSSANKFFLSFIRRGVFDRYGIETAAATSFLTDGYFAYFYKRTCETIFENAERWVWQCDSVGQ